ncbi:MAG: TonB-dependent receptor family protein [Phenylobacterium sp.]|uniref:TonB-dependent receptor family protein n=1 Tax=Phenylobacterium sp. TaxID=1871053 RepID=UPI00391D4471
MKSVLLAGGAVCALALPVAAQAADADTLVDSVIVTARPDPEDPAVVAQARRRLSETPGAVSVISAESYERRFALALDDMLRDAPGVFAQRKWGGDIRLSIRGSGLGNANHNRGLFLAQDGLPLNEADGYGDSQIADPLIARFTEVYRGGNALRFGGALLGGAVNMVTPTGADAGFSQKLRLDGGAFGLLRQHAEIAHAGESWDAFTAVTNQTGQGWRPQSQQNIQFASLNLGRTFGEDREVRLILNGANIKQEIPGALTWSQFQADPRQAAAGNYANDYSRDVRGLRGSLRARWRLDEATVVEGGLYAVWKDLDHPIFQVIDQQSRNYGAFARADWEGELAGHRADAYAGLWLRQGDLDQAFYVNRQGARGALRSLSLQNAKAADLFAEGRLFIIDQLAIVGGATLGWTSRDYRSFAVPGVGGAFDLAASREFDWIAPRIGVLWEAEDGAQVFANLTRSVEPPNFGALSPTGTGFAPVEPQTAWTAEIGARGRRGPLTWDVTLYRAELRKELLQYTVSQDVPATTFNADRTVHQGLEAAVDWRFAPGWRLRQTWTWSDFRFEGDRQYGDNRLPVVPEHLYRAELRYEHSAGWFVAPTLERATRAWADFRNTAAAPAYTVVHLNAGVALNGTTTVFVDARNLTNEAYVTNVQPVISTAQSPAVYWPGDGRSVFAGIVLAF